MSVDPADASTGERLPSLFAELGDEIAAAAGEVPVLDRVVDVAVARMPGADFASITQARGRSYLTVAATDDRAHRADAIQYALRSGPCVDAIAEHGVKRSDDIANDPAWPQFGPQASSEVGVGSMASFRLAFEVDGVAGGLNVYSGSVAAFGAQDLMIGALIATHAAWAMATDLARKKATNLLQALETSRDIGVAIGVLMTAHKVTRDQAFELLRISSQGAHRKLRDVAIEVAETGRLPLPAVKPARKPPQR